jgi:hypothetical protein
MSTCFFSIPFLLDAAPGPQADQVRAAIQNGSTWSVAKTCYVQGAIIGIIGLGFVILGLYVRRGKSAATVVSCVLAGILSLLFALSTLANFVMLNDPAHAMGACFGVIITAFMILEFVWLIQAAIASGKVGLAQQQYAAQYWQYQQTMQAYANAGYGYQTPPQAPLAPPEPPVPAPPPADQPRI